MSSRENRESSREDWNSSFSGGGKILKPKRLRRLSSSTISSRMSEDEFRASLVGAVPINRQDSSDDTIVDTQEFNRMYFETRGELVSSPADPPASSTPLPVSPEIPLSAELPVAEPGAEPSRPQNEEIRDERTDTQLLFNEYSSDDLDEDAPIFENHPSSSNFTTQPSNHLGFTFPDPPTLQPTFPDPPTPQPTFPDPPSLKPTFSVPYPVLSSTSSEDIPSTSTSNDEGPPKKIPSKNRGRKTTRPFTQSTQGSEIPLPKRVKIAINKEKEQHQNQNQPITNFLKRKSTYNSRKAQSETTSTSTSTEPSALSKPPVVKRTNFIRNYDSSASCSSSVNENENTRIGIIKLHGKNWNGNAWTSKVLQEEGTWVECVDCKKWRYLPEIQDPALLPKLWTCKNHPNATYNDCSKPEQKYPHTGAYKYWVYCDLRLTIGSIVWTGINGPGLPWPAIVEIDPITAQFMKKGKHFDSIHVTMMPSELGKFQRPVTKWVSSNDITPFVDLGLEDVDKSGEFTGDREKWRAAYLFATHANMQENAKTRLENYGLEFQIKMWSEHEAQPGKQIDYQSNKEVIARLEFVIKNMEKRRK